MGQSDPLVITGGGVAVNASPYDPTDLTQWGFFVPVLLTYRRPLQGDDMETLKDLVKDKMVTFQWYSEGELIYKTDDGFEFPVPISDTGTGTFKACDKAILYMRWIRKHMETVRLWKQGE